MPDHNFALRIVNVPFQFPNRFDILHSTIVLERKKNKKKNFYFFHVRTNFRLSHPPLSPPPPPSLPPVLPLPALSVPRLSVFLKWVQESVEGADSFDFLYIAFGQ